MSWRPFDWYETPLYYDIVFDGGTAEEADFLEAVCDRHGAPGRRRVLEPACGTGRLVAEMTRRGWRATGVDRSRPSLDFARRRLRAMGRRARLLETPMESFSLPPEFDLAHCLVSSFRYLPDEDAARRHLECVAAALRPGGLYVLGLHLSDYDDDACRRERWVETRDGVRVTCNIQSWPADRRTRTERFRSRLVVEGDGPTRRYETSWDFRTYGAGQLKRLLRSVPAFDCLATYGFTYDFEDRVTLDGERLDVVLVLRRGAVRP